MRGSGRPWCLEPQSSDTRHLHRTKTRLLRRLRLPSLDHALSLDTDVPGRTGGRWTLEVGPFRDRLGPRCFVDPFWTKTLESPSIFCECYQINTKTLRFRGGVGVYPLGEILSDFVYELRSSCTGRKSTGESFDLQSWFGLYYLRFTPWGLVP